MGDVFLARLRPKDGPARLVALKRIRPALVENADAQARFEREAKVSALLRHPCIVATLDHGTDAQGPFLLLEYVEGRTAARLVALARERGLHVPLEVALSVLVDVAQGLACAHGHTDAELGLKGVLHRDITPDNVLIGYDGTARLADFGIAKLLGGTDLSGAGTVTVTGAIAGKAGYIAPELYEGGAPSFASDLFSFGATAFRILTGTAAFRADSEAGVMRAVLTAAAPKLATLRPDVPPEVSELVALCLEKQPAARPASAKEVADTLAAALPPSEEARRAEVARLLGEWFPERGPGAEAARLGGAAGPGASRTVTASVGDARGVTGGRRRWLGALAAAALALAALAVFLRWPRGALPSPPPEPGPGLAASGGAPSEPGAEAPALSPPPPGTSEAPPGSERTGDARDDEPRKVEASRRQKVKTARLRLRIQPWAMVFLDGRSLGSTPLGDQELAPGTHSLILVNPELDVRRSFTVKLRPGERKTFAVTLGAKRQADSRSAPGR